jgi:hypothetical protein
MTRTLRAATVLIGNKLSLDERISLSDGFVNDIKEMCESGLSIIASQLLWHHWMGHRRREFEKPDRDIE